MTTISIKQMQQDPLGYLQRVERGETILIVRDSHPVAEIKPVAAVADQLRPVGLCKGEFMVPNDFDAPLPDDILDQFES